MRYAASAGYVQPDDVGVFPAHEEFDAIHGGGAAYFVFSITLPELLATLKGADHLADPDFWNAKRLHRTDPRIGSKMLQGLKGIISDIENRFTPLVRLTKFGLFRCAQEASLHRVGKHLCEFNRELLKSLRSRAIRPAWPIPGDATTGIINRQVNLPRQLQLALKLT